MIKLAEISTIISNIKLTLRSFSDAGLIDDIEILRHAEYIIRKLDVGLMTNFELVLDVEDYKANLPENFEHLNFVYRCSCLNSENDKVKKKYFFGRKHTFKVVDFNSCYYDKCDLTPEEHWITRTIYLEGEEDVVKHKYKKEELLTQVKRVSSNSPILNSKSENHFSIEGDKLYVNYKEGSLLFSYWGYTLDDDGYFKVIDHPYYIKAIETYVIYQILLSLYYNSEADVQQRMLYAEKEYNKAVGEASYLSKISDYNDFIRKGNYMSKKVDIFNIPSNADFNKHQRNTNRC